MKSSLIGAIAVSVALSLWALSFGLIYSANGSLAQAEATSAATKTIGTFAAPFVEEVIVACVATAGGTEIETGSGQSHFGCECFPPDTTVIHYADDGVTTSSAGFALSGASRPWFVAAQGGYCLSASGTVNVPCTCHVAMEP